MKQPKADYDAKVIEVTAAKAEWDTAKAASDAGVLTLTAQDGVVGADVSAGKKKDKKTKDDDLATYNAGDLKTKQDAFKDAGKAIGDAWKAVLDKAASETWTGAADKKCKGTDTAENFTEHTDDTYDDTKCKAKCAGKPYYDTTNGKSAIPDGDYCYGYELVATGNKCRVYKKILAEKDDAVTGDGCY